MIQRNTLQSLKPLLTEIGVWVIDLLNSNWDSIDSANSRIEEEDEYIILKLTGNGEQCDINFALSKISSNTEEISFYLNDDGQIIYNVLINNHLERDNVKALIKDVLSHPVNMSRVIVNGKVYKSNYIYSSDCKKYLAINKLVFPWSKRKIKKVLFCPWIG